MRKQYQKTCPICGEKIVVSHIADFGQHVCIKKQKAEKPVVDEKPVERKRKKWQEDDNV
jgi:hypothetical protein